MASTGGVDGEVDVAGSLGGVAGMVVGEAEVVDASGSGVVSLTGEAGSWSGDPREVAWGWDEAIGSVGFLSPQGRPEIRRGSVRTQVQAK